MSLGGPRKKGQAYPTNYIAEEGTILVDGPHFADNKYGIVYAAKDGERTSASFKISQFVSLPTSDRIG